MLPSTSDQRRLTTLILSVLLAACEGGEFELDGPPIEADPDPTLDVATTPAEPWGGLIGGAQDPVEPGIFCPCTHHEQSFNDAGDPARIYWPGSLADLEAPPEERCDPTPECETYAGLNHPLVILAHANGSTIHSYPELGNHLASHGIVLVSIPNSETGFRNRLGDAIDFAEAEFGPGLGKRTALIGHSLGGHMMALHNSELQDHGDRTLDGVALLAPRVDVGVNYPLDNVGALLGVHWAKDNDGATYGANNGTFTSVFHSYDNAGLVAGDPDAMTVAKDFVFFNFINGHHMQDQDGVIAYTTAFLRRELFGETAQDDHLRHQRPLIGLPPNQLPVSQQHARSQRLVIANFESGLNEPTWYGGVNTTGIIEQPSERASDDPFSPHLTKLKPLDIPAFAGTRRAEIVIDGGVDVSSYNYLVFRITQRYHDIDNPTGGDLDFEIGLELGGGGEVFAQASNYQDLSFPVVVNSIEINAMFVDATKNAMRTYLIPLDDFGAVTQVESVILDFSNEPALDYALSLDDVEFAR